MSRPKRADAPTAIVIKLPAEMVRELDRQRGELPRWKHVEALIKRAAIAEVESK